MRPTWDDVNARVRGLGTHLLDSRQLDACALAGDLGSLADLLRHAGVVTGETPLPVKPANLELEVRRWAAGILGILARWVGARHPALPQVFANADRRSLRAMFRGAAQGAPAERRLAGLIPTPALPEAALEELARATTAGEIVAHLGAWHHPFAASLAATAGGIAGPDLFVLELVLATEVAAQAVRAAERAGDGPLRRHVEESIDLENALTAVVLSSDHVDVVPGDLFVAGGCRIGMPEFEEAIATGAPGPAGAMLARALGAAPCADGLLRVGVPMADVEDDLLRCRLRVLARRVRRDPLGPLLIVHFALRLEVQVADLQSIIWGATLGLVDRRMPHTEAATR